jgi:C4-dicarboxylate transporter DctQ subunit
MPDVPFFGQLLAVNALGEGNCCMKLIDKANSVFDGIVNACAVLAAVLVTIMMISISASVVARTFFDSTWLGLVEFTQTGILYVTFLGAPWVLKQERHVVMDLITGKLSPRNQLIINIITSIICALMCLVLTGYSTAVTWERWSERVYLYDLLHVLDAYVLLIIPIGSLMLFIQFLRRTKGFFKELGSPLGVKTSPDNQKVFKT